MERVEGGGERERRGDEMVPPPHFWNKVTPLLRLIEALRNCASTAKVAYSLIHSLINWDTSVLRTAIFQKAAITVVHVV